jgi:5'(3')-deoxyribonucleotidase
MGFVLCNAQSTFTRLMTHVLCSFIHLFVIAYLGDVYILSTSSQQHLDHVQKILTTLRENALFIEMVTFFFCQNAKLNLSVVSSAMELFGHLLGKSLTTEENWPLDKKCKSKFIIHFDHLIVNVFITLEIDRHILLTFAASRYPGNSHIRLLLELLCRH